MFVFKNKTFRFAEGFEYFETIQNVFLTFLNPEVFFNAFCMFYHHHFMAKIAAQSMPDKFNFIVLTGVHVKVDDCWIDWIV